MGLPHDKGGTHVKHFLQHGKRVILVLLGTALMSFGLVYFNMENNLADGGFTGITLILFFVFTIDPAISNIVLNIPMFFIGYRVLGRPLFIYTLIGTFGLSFFLWLFQTYRIVDVPLQDDLTLAALFAGVFIGAGLGMVFRYGGTTGGADIIAKLMFNYSGVSIGRTLFIIDALVITSSLVYLNYREAMYTLVAVFVASRVVDFIQQGAYSGKAAFIISENSEAIADAILLEMDRGATLLSGRGSFTGTNKEILYCVVSRHEITRLKNLIDKVDPLAFVSITNVQDIAGEGFTFDDEQKPLQ
ncbi:YitT family protein [Salicibibacter cibarius]|uniref:YitT family protein n=2 Tax=Salicibibacter cibarius TaxID=2743000 RepID=A0A7T7CBI9_9BACI|nr:YitT family protein [Salicibibacter cibarius]